MRDGFERMAARTGRGGREAKAMLMGVESAVTGQ
jgi:hypothetical protein